MYTSIANTHCKECGSNDIVDDYSTGDLICKECGLVLDRLMQTSYFVETHSESISNKYEPFIRNFCYRHQLNESTIKSALEYTTYHTVEFGDLKMIVYAIHLIETKDNIHVFSKKKKIDLPIIQNIVNRIRQQYRIRVIDSDNDQENEWIKCLYQEIVDTERQISKTTLMKIKRDIQSLVQNKPEALFYSSSVLATVLLVKYKIPIKHKLPSSKIRKIMKELFI